MRRRAVAAFADLGVELPDVTAPVGTMSGGQRQSVAVARAVAYASEIIFMDEPTAALGVVQRERVLDNIRRVRDRGHHRGADQPQHARGARRSGPGGSAAHGPPGSRGFTASETTIEQLVGAMTGALTTEES